MCAVLLISIKEIVKIAGSNFLIKLKLIFLTSTSLLYLKKDIISKNDKAIKPNITALLNEILFFEV